jgi:hypothetical protein
MYKEFFYNFDSLLQLDVAGPILKSISNNLEQKSESSIKGQLLKELSSYFLEEIDLEEY